MASATVEHAPGARLAAADQGFTFHDEARECGVVDLRLELLADGVAQAVRYDTVKTVEGGLDASGPVGETFLRCETELRLVPGLNAATVRHTLVNPTEGRTVRLARIVTAQAPETGTVHAGKSRHWDLRYCHTDNLRTERYPYCQMEAPYVRALPAHPIHCGLGEDQPLPCIYFTDVDYTAGLVLGATAQEKTFQTWYFDRDPNKAKGLFRTFEIHHELPLADGLDLAPGASLPLDGTYLQIHEGVHPQDAYQDYLRYLADRYDFRGKKSHLLDEAFYCSWNYGRFSHQYRDELLETARWIAENLPNMTYFLVDAGYTAGTEGQWGGCGSNMASAFYPDANAAVSGERFPGGMKAFADELRALGLKPGIWWSPTAMLDSTLYTDHPDWFLRDASGAPYRIGKRNGFLDLTQPGPRRFIDESLAVILGEWGMEALKMDFWSQQFEDRDARLATPGRTALDARTFLFDTVRKHLPEDGVFMTCVATGMGNPFLATHADTHRNTIDIGKGDWKEQIWTCYWALPILGVPGRLTYLHNNDSVGINLDCPDHENYLRLTWCFVTMGMQEAGGYFTKLPAPWVKALRKFTDRCDRGYRCLCPDEKAWRGEPLPEVLYVDYPEGSPTRAKGIRQSVALFNWSDTPRMVSVRRADLGQDGLVEAEDFWTEARETLDGEFLAKRLDGRSAALLDILG